MRNRDTLAGSMGFTEEHSGYEGLTKREYAAIHIAAGLCANPSNEPIIELSVKLADELFAELERTE